MRRARPDIVHVHNVFPLLSGSVVRAAADLLKRVANPNDDDIGKIANLCRCGTYPRIRKAIKRAVEITKENAARESGKK